MMKNNHKRGAAITMAGFVPVILMLSATALAQDDATDEALEEIVVTGSHIEGLSVESLPVSVMGSDEIRDLGAPSMFDLLGYIPAVGDFEFEDSSNGTNAARGDVAGVNLRGIGSGNTLVLLNGRRMVVNPTFQPINSVPSTFYNTQSVPGSSVSRIEVLRDGASAIYGADASAGVVNIITRGAEDGFRISGKYASGDTNYDESEITGGGSWTINNGKTEIALFANYYERSHVHMNELDDLYYDLNRRGNPSIPEEWRNDSQLDNRSSLTPWARVSVGALNADNQFIGTTMHVDPATPNSLVAGSGSERYNFNETAWVTPEVDRANVFASIEHDFDNGMQIFGDAYYYQSKSNTQRAASPLDDSLAFLIVPGDAYYAPPEAAGQDILLLGWRPIDLGPRVIEVKKDSFRVMGGLRGDFGSWSWESALLYSKAEDTDTEGNRQAKSLFTDQISVDSPDALNPFGGPTGNSEAALAGIRIDATDVRTSELTLWDFRLNQNELFNAPGGPVGFATGIEVRRDEYDEDRDPRLDGSMPFDNGAIFDESDVIGVSATFDSSASRTTTGLYGELFIPLVGEPNAKSFTNALELSLAVRYENTSDFGSATKPKIGLRWEIAGGFALRGSYSEGFRAPNLPQMNQGTIVRRIDGVDDPWRSDVTGLPIDTGDTYRKTTRIANSELQAEDTETTMFGIVFSPHDGPLEGFRVTADWFNIKQEGVVGIQSASDSLDLDFILMQQGSSNPEVERAAVTAADQAAFDAWNADPANVNDQRAAAGEAINVSNMYMNLDPREVEGWDALIEYLTPETRAGEFRFRAEATKITKFEQLGFATTDLLRRNGNPELRTTASINWRKAGFNANVSMRFVDDVYDTSLYATGPDFEGTYNPDLNRTYWDVDDWTVYNMALSYDFSETSSGWAEGLSATAGVRNFTDEKPPFADESFGYFTKLHNAYGRVVWGQLTYNF